MKNDHEGFTHILFVDAIVGVGTECLPIEALIAARAESLVYTQGIGDTDYEAWSRQSLETLSLSTLQDLYIRLKTYEVTHADKF